ncbi:hypothetical protein QJQ45_018168 [Haematococcus lacustris]|nr:hypothetical protein QJQ45_018168 [Haematococcus lacustris]
MAVTDFEAKRLARMAENQRRMAELGLLKQKSLLDTYRVVKDAPAAPTSKKPITRKALSYAIPRRSRRLVGDKAAYCELGDSDQPLHEIGEQDELVDLLDRRAYREALSHLEQLPEPSQEAMEAVQAARCASQGRGSVYAITRCELSIDCQLPCYVDSAIGITCHFCRQKKLCGEEDCKRCSSRDASQPCSGKTECSRCHGATGRFCRACLHIRYGQTLEATHSGEWLCPHCYEEEHPDTGWICNSSICLKRRGLKPTGIAIYDAHQRGFKSVGHLLQAELQKRGCSSVLSRQADSQPATEVYLPSDNQQPESPAAEAPGMEDVPLAARVSRRGRQVGQQQEGSQTSVVAKRVTRQNSLRA